MEETLQQEAYNGVATETNAVVMGAYSEAGDLVSDQRLSDELRDRLQADRTMIEANASPFQDVPEVGDTAAIRDRATRLEGLGGQSHFGDDITSLRATSINSDRYRNLARLAEEGSELARKERGFLVQD
jgi:hypothetical protein